MADGLHIGVLGPLEVRAGATERIVLSAGKQRAVLGVLAARANQTTSMPALIDALWPRAAPANSKAAVLNYVARLRRNLDSAAPRLRTAAAGYVLDIHDDAELDLLHAKALEKQARRAAADRHWDTAHRCADAALSLWRGEPFEDVPVESLRADSGPALDGLRLHLQELRIDAFLHTGRFEQAYASLRGLMASRPMHEPFHERAVIALYGARRRADALDTYARARRTLRDELGVDPSPVLQTLHRLILRDAPVGEVIGAWRGVPGRGASRTGDAARAQAAAGRLPARPALVVGRADEFAPLTDLLCAPTSSDSPDAPDAPDAPDSADPGSRVAVLSGPAGVGKTTLALAWAHQVADRFPDGCVYLDLRGFAPEARPLSTDRAVGVLLDLLGAPAREVPATADGRQALYRKAVEGRRMLFVLDNVRDAGQVRGLLPAAESCRTLVTSRGVLTPLIAFDGAEPVGLSPLTASAACELLTVRLGATRVAGRDDVVAGIAEHCAHLPLALAIAAARAAAMPTVPLEALAAQFQASVLDALETGEDAGSVRGVLSWSHAQLPEPAAKVFRFLGLHPGPDITAASAAALADMPLAEAARHMAGLAAVSLITETAPGRFTMHALVRAFAAEQVAAGDSEAERRSARHRLLEYHLSWATAADHVYVTLPTEIALDGVELPAGLETRRFAGNSDAMDWMVTEQDVLSALVRSAADNGFDSYAWRLAAAQSCSLMIRMLRQEDLRGGRIGLAAARRLGDPHALAHAHWQIGRAQIFSGEFDDGEEHLRQALEGYRAVGDLAGIAETLRAQGTSSANQADYANAAVRFREYVISAQRLGHMPSLGNALVDYGDMLRKLGRYEAALAACTKALRIIQEFGPARFEMHTWNSLGLIHQHTGNVQASVYCFRRAVELRELTDVNFRTYDWSAVRLAAADGDLALARRKCLDIRNGLPDDDWLGITTFDSILAEIDAAEKLSR